MVYMDINGGKTIRKYSKRYYYYKLADIGINVPWVGTTITYLKNRYESALPTAPELKDTTPIRPSKKIALKNTMKKLDIDEKKGYRTIEDRLPPILKDTTPIKSSKKITLKKTFDSLDEAVNKKREENIQRRITALEKRVNNIIREEPELEEELPLKIGEYRRVGVNSGKKSRKYTRLIDVANYTAVKYDYGEENEELITIKRDLEALKRIPKTPAISGIIKDYKKRIAEIIDNRPAPTSVGIGDYYKAIMGLKFINVRVFIDTQYGEKALNLTRKEFNNLMKKYYDYVNGDIDEIITTNEVVGSDAEFDIIFDDIITSKFSITVENEITKHNPINVKGENVACRRYAGKIYNGYLLICENPPTHIKKKRVNCLKWCMMKAGRVDLEGVNVFNHGELRGDFDDTAMGLWITEKKDKTAHCLLVRCMFPCEKIEFRDPVLGNVTCAEISVPVKDLPMTITPMNGGGKYNKKNGLKVWVNDGFDMEKSYPIVVRIEHDIINKFKPEYICTFDYETVYGWDYFLRPYSLAYVIKQVDGDEVLRKCIISSELDASYLNERFMQDLEKFKNVLCVSFNGSRFDNFLLVGDLIGKYGDKENYAFATNNDILTMKFNGNMYLDLARFCVGSLDKNLKNFGCTFNKTVFDHEKTQMDFFSKKYLDIDEKELIAYNINDVVSLMELYEKVHMAVKQVTGLDIYDYMTLGQLGMDKCRSTGPAYFKFRFQEKKIEESKKFDEDPWEEFYNFMRKSIIAGRSQIFKQGHFSIDLDRDEKLMNGEIPFDGICSLDVKSLYPFIMMTCKFPYGMVYDSKPEWSIEQKLRYPGVYHVKVISQPARNIIPKRGDTLDWNYAGPFDTVLTTVDIKMLLNYGSDIIVGKGIYFTQEDHVFVNYLTPLLREKSKQDALKNKKQPYNASIREICKLGANAISGKMCQRVFENTTKLYGNYRENEALDAFIKQHHDVTIPLVTDLFTVVQGKKDKLKYNRMAPAHIGSFIYSYSRAFMYKFLNLFEDQVYCTDTDSIHINKFVYHNAV